MLDRARQIETDQPLGICYVRGDAAGTTWWDGVPHDGVLCHMALMDIDDQNGYARTLSHVVSHAMCSGCLRSSQSCAKSSTANSAAGCSNSEGGNSWRKLNPGRQALLVLAYPRKGDTFAGLAAGFGIGTATAWRYVTETVTLLAGRAPKLRQALTGAKKAGHAYVVIDGTLIPIDRVAADRPFCCGKHRRHGMNLQVIASPSGEIVWVSGPLPGAVHDLTAARIWGIIRQLAAAGLITLADKGYHGAGEPILTPYRGRNKPTSQKDANRAHAQLRSPGERANAQLKIWHILRKLRCCPWKAGHLAKAIHVLQAREIAG